MGFWASLNPKLGLWGLYGLRVWGDGGSGLGFQVRFDWFRVLKHCLQACVEIWSYQRIKEE